MINKNSNAVADFDMIKLSLASPEAIK